MQGYASGDIQTFYIYFSQIGHGPYKNVLVGNSDYFICHFIVIGIYRGRYIGQKQAEKAEEEAPRTAWDNSTFAEVQLALMQSLSRKVRVEFKKGEKKGRLVIEFYDEQDLKGLAALFDRGQG